MDFLDPLGFEPRTSRVLGERDNHYTMGSGDYRRIYSTPKSAVLYVVHLGIDKIDLQEKSCQLIGKFLSMSIFRGIFLFYFNLK